MEASGKELETWDVNVQWALCYGGESMLQRIQNAVTNIVNFLDALFSNFNNATLRGNFIMCFHILW